MKADERILDQEYIDRFLSIEGLHPLIAECDFTIREVMQNEIPEIDFNIYKSNRNRFKEITSYILGPVEYILVKKFDYYSSLGMKDSISLDLLAHDGMNHKFIPVSHMYAFEISAHLANLQRSLGAIMFLTGSQGEHFGNPDFEPAKHDLDIQFLVPNGKNDLKNKLIQFGSQYGMVSNTNWDLVKSSNIPGYFYNNNVSPLVLKWLNPNFSNYVERNLSSFSIKIFQKEWSLLKIRLNVCEKGSKSYDFGRMMVELGFPDIDGLPSVFYDLKKTKSLFRYSPEEPWYSIELQSKPSYENIRQAHPLLGAIMSLRCITKHKIGDDLNILNSISIPKLSEVLGLVDNHKYHKTFVNPLIDCLASAEQDPMLFASVGFYNLVSNCFPKFTDQMFDCLVFYLNACGVQTEDLSKEHTYYIITQLWLNTKKDIESNKIRNHSFYSQCIDLMKFKLSFDNPRMRESVLNNKLKSELENIFNLVSNL